MRHLCVTTDINKFLWMVRIGGSTDTGRHIKEHDYYTPTGEFRVDREGSPVLLNCLMYKMCYYRFGQVYTEASEYRRHVHATVQPVSRLTLSRQVERLVTMVTGGAASWSGALKDEMAVVAVCDQAQLRQPSSFRAFQLHPRACSRARSVHQQG